MNQPLAYKAEFDNDTLWVALVDGRVLNAPLVCFPRLQGAAPAQRSNYRISGGGTGLHWDDLDETISVEHLLTGYADRNAQPFTTR